MTEVEPAYPMRCEELGVPEKDIESLLRAKDILYSAAKLPATKPVIDRWVNCMQGYLCSFGRGSPKTHRKMHSARLGTKRSR